MNRIQRTILILYAVAAFVGGFLLVPWTGKLDTGRLVQTTAIGYAPMFLPPEVTSPAGVAVDVRRVFITLVTLTLAAAAAMLAAGRWESRETNR